MIKVLIVDDEPLICAILETYLKKIAEVKTCLSAVAAIEEMKEFKPDVIVSDYHMPEMTGLDLVHKLRGEGDLIPVLLISGSHIDESEREEFTDFIKKPITPAEIISKVKKMVPQS